MMRNPDNPNGRDSNSLAALLPAFATTASHPHVPTTKRHIIRHRPTLSCETCRKRRTKCDKLHPICTRCARTLSPCVYVESSRTPKDPLAGARNARAEARRPRWGSREDRAVHADSKSDPQAASVPTSNAARNPPPSIFGASPTSIESRLDRLTSLVEGLSRVHPIHRAEDLGQLNGKPVQGVEGTDVDDTAPNHLGPVGATGSMTRGRLNPSSQSSRTESPTGEFALPLSDAHDDDLFDDHNVGYLSLEDGGQPRYVGTTYWAYLSDELDHLKQLFQNQDLSRDSNDPGNAHRPSVDASAAVPRSVRGLSTATEHGVDGMDRDQESNAGSYSVTSSNPISPYSPKSDFDGDFSFKRKINMAAILQNLPSKRQSHVLFRCWFSGVHCYSPIVYIPLILDKYNQFWAWYETKEEADDRVPDPQFLPLLFAIWYGGSVSVSVTALQKWFPGAVRSSLSDRFYEQVTWSFEWVAFPRAGSLLALTAFLFVRTIRENEEEPMLAGLHLGVALRVAQAMGLHRDPELFGLPPWEAEMRRRIWWHILHTDNCLAVASGLPTLVDDQCFCDTKIISELKDSNLGTAEGVEYEAAVGKGSRGRDVADNPLKPGLPSVVDVNYVSCRGKYILSNAVRKLIKIRLGTRRITRKEIGETKDILQQVKHEVHDILKRIPTYDESSLGLQHADHSSLGDTEAGMANPPCHEDLDPLASVSKNGLAKHPPSYHRNCLISFHRWSRDLLLLVLEKLYCISYQPFLRSPKSSLWPHARQNAIRHCHNFMQRYISLASTPAYGPFQWSWPASPMHSAMILLIDLYTRPNSEEAPTSRAYLDRLFSISDPDASATNDKVNPAAQKSAREGGREAWNLFLRLSGNAGQKASRDPSVFWTHRLQEQAESPKTSLSVPSNQPMTDSSADTAWTQNGTQNSKVAGVSASTAINSRSLSAGNPVVSSHLPQFPITNTPWYDDFNQSSAGARISQPTSSCSGPTGTELPIADTQNGFNSFTNTMIPPPPQTLSEPQVDWAAWNSFLSAPAFTTRPSEAETQGLPVAALTQNVAAKGYMDAPAQMQYDPFFEPQFDWDQWEALDGVFGQGVQVDIAMDFVDWEGSGPQQFSFGELEGPEFM